MDLSTKNIFKVLSIITIFLLLLLAIYKVMWVFGWLAAALLITTLLAPVAGFFQKFMPKKNRGLAVFATFLVVLAAFIGIGFLVLPPLLNELTAMGTQVTQWVNEAIASGKYDNYIATAQSQGSQVSTNGILDAVKNATQYITTNLKSLVSSISGGVYAFITITTLTFFMLLDTDSVVRGISYYLPSKQQPMFKKLSNDLFTLISKYFAGVLIVGIIAGFAAYIPLAILNVPYASALALTVAVFDLIPMVGATIGGIIVVVVCVLSGNIPAGIIMGIFFLIYQQIENNLVIPLVQKQTVKISPLGILIALLIGGALGGVIGTLLAIPGAAFIKIVYEKLKSGGTLGQKAKESTLEA